MNEADRYEALAKLTGLPNLATINDPERLERLVDAAKSSLAHSTRHCPLRYKVAYREYAEGADRLQHIANNYLDVQQDILETFLNRGEFQRLGEPTVLENGSGCPA
jgi:hypothetical protein